MNARENERFDKVVLYSFARVEQALEDYARSNQVSAHLLTQRVGELLLAQTNGSLLGTHDSLPALRGNPAPGSQPLEPVALAGRAHHSAQVKGDNPHQQRLNTMIRMYEQGAPVKEIAEKLGVAGATIYTSLKRARDQGTNIAMRTTNAGHSYNGTHWTQLPKNKARLRKQMNNIRQRRNG